MLAFLLAPFYLLFNLYLFRRIMGWVRAWFPWFRKRKHWAVPAALYAFFALSFVLAFPLPAGRLKRALMLIGNYWLGVLLYLLLAVLLADGLRLLLVHGLKLRSLRSARMHRIAGCLCAAAILVTSVGGVINARIVRVTPYEITVNKSAGSMESMKVVLLADLHLGYNVGLAQMERMVARVNEQDADVVVIAGDIFDNAWEAVEEPEQIAAVLRGIRSRYGVYAVYGNHDIEEPILAGFTFRSDGKKQSSPEMDAFLASANIRLLRDEAVLLGGEVYLYGRPDAQRPGRGVEVRKTPAEFVEGLDADKPILVLDHQPRELEALAAAGVDVDLCGHTHDGQMFPRQPHRPAILGECLRLSPRGVDAQHRDLGCRSLRAEYARGDQGRDLPHHHSLYELKKGSGSVKAASLFYFFSGSSFQSVKPRISAPPASCGAVTGSPSTVTETMTATSGSM